MIISQLSWYHNLTFFYFSLPKPHLEVYTAVHCVLRYITLAYWPSRSDLFFTRVMYIIFKIVI